MSTNIFSYFKDISAENKKAHRSEKILCGTQALKN